MALPTTRLVTVALVLIAGSAGAVEMGPHARLACLDCHVTDAEGRPVEPAGRIDDQDVTCQRCHTGAKAPHRADHPVFVVPKSEVPGQFPLDTQGRLTCSTCHSMHETAPALLRTRESWGCPDCHVK